MARVYDLLVRARGETADAQAAMRELQASVDRAGKTMTRVGSRMSLGITAPLVAAGTASFRSFARFDQTMRQVGSVADASSRDLAKLREEAKRLGAETSFSAQDVSTAMLELAKGGVSQAEMGAGVLKQTLTLAAAGSLELGSAAGYMANTLNAFGLKARNAAGVAAALAGGANASTASVESLGMGLAQVGAQAGIAGMSMNETIAALAAFDQAGVKGSDAGTSLKVMLQRLVPQTDTAAEAMKALGLNFTDAQGNFKPMREVAQELQIALGKLGSESERTSALHKIFGSDASRAASILGSVGAKGIDKYTKATENLAAAQDLAKVNTSGAAGAMERARGALETAGITIGEVLAPHVVAAANAIGSLATSFAALDQGTQSAILLGAALTATLGPALMSVGMMMQGFAASSLVFSAAAGGMIRLATGVGTLAFAATSAIPALNALSLAIAANPILAGAVVLTGVVAGAVALGAMASASDDAAISAKEAADAIKALDDAAAGLADNNLRHKEAILGVQMAQERANAASANYVQAIKQYGKGSAEARAAHTAEKQALLAVERAQLTLKDARTKNVEGLKQAKRSAKENIDVIVQERLRQQELRREIERLEQGGARGKKGIEGLRKELRESEQASWDARQSLNKAEKAFRDVGPAAAGAKQPAKDLARVLRDVPKKVQTRIELIGWESAMNKINRWAENVARAARVSESAMNGGGGGKGNNRSKSRGRLSTPGLNAFGEITNPGQLTMQSVLNFSSMASGQAFETVTGDDGQTQVVGNSAVISFLEWRRSQAQARLKSLVKERGKLPGKIKAAKAAKLKAHQALSRAEAAGNKTAIENARKKLDAARDRVANLEGRRDFLDAEILSLGGQIQADSDALIPPDVSDANADAAENAAREAENLRREALGLASLEEEAKLNAINTIRAQYGLPPVNNISEIGKSPTAATPSLVQGSNPQPLMPTSQGALDAVRDAAMRALTGGNTVNLYPQSGDPEAIANRVAMILGSSMLRAGGAV